MRGLILILAAALVLSGCSGKGTTSSTTTTATVTTTPPAPGQGTITVQLDRTNVDGPVPLKVNFTLSATFKGADGKTAKPSPSVTVIYHQKEDANGTKLSDNAQEGPTISTLPAAFSLTFDSPGKWDVVATVKASGYKDGAATVTILPRAPGGSVTGPAPLFVDSAEGDTSQWTLSAKVLIVDFNGVVPEQETPADHPTGKWTVSDKEARTGTHSWYSDYPDSYRGRIVSLPIKVPASGGLLSFYYKGGAESNGYDGLFVYVNGEQRLFNANVLKAWTYFSTPVPGGDVTLEFRFDSDPSCSSALGAPAGCGTGWDAGGYYVDDIWVT